MQVRHDGSGGIPSGAALVPENADTWAAPAPIGMSQNDGHHLGQIVGASHGMAEVNSSGVHCIASN